jgi:pimeloyl-ACP methyl ester carboxylesterase
MKPSDVRKIATRHGEVAVHAAGRGDRPTLLFIHGNSSCGSVFEHQFSSPLAARYRLLAMDLPGHGESPDALDPEKSYSMPSYAEAAADVLCQLRIDDPVVIGWSLGGHIGLEMTRIIPGMRGLVITGTPPSGPGAQEVTQAFAQIPEIAFAASERFTPEQEEIFARYIYSLTMPIPPHLMAAVQRCDGRSRRFMFGDFLNPESRLNHQTTIVASWPKPLAIIQGTDEPFMSGDYFARLSYANLWRGKVHMIEGCGHAPFWEKPEVYNPLLDAFVDDLV